MKRFLYFMFLGLLFFSCERGALTSLPDELEGVWFFKGYEYAGTPELMPDCEAGMKDVTLEISRMGDHYRISGRSFINTYLSDAEVKFKGSGQKAGITIEAVGTTKMGGPEYLMNCENVYYQSLRNATAVKIENGRLYLEREPVPQDSRLWLTLVFEKKQI